MIYTTLDSDEKIEKQCLAWGEERALAIDFECEYNLHIYGEHLCLIQIFDKERFFIIDVRSPMVTEKGIKRFLSLPNQKIWFAYQGDGSLIYKKYKMKIKNIFDVRVPAKLLGFDGNLVSLIKEFLNVEININKKKNQTANWLVRPLDIALIDYALLDVKYLFSLKDVLDREIKGHGLEESVKKEMVKATIIKEPKPGWKNVGPYKKMKREEKRNLKAYFIQRDKIAKRFNVPAERVLSKKTLLSLSLNPPKDREELAYRIKNEPQRFRKMIEDSLWSVTQEEVLSAVHPLDKK